LICLSIKVPWSILSVHKLVLLSRLYSENDSQSRQLTLRIESLLGDMQGLVEGLALLRAMPRSADV
jgi:membrane protein implicated in regulation of membrane protease activity